MLINHNYKSENYKNRNGEPVQFLVIHYTDVPLYTALAIFTNNTKLAEQEAEYFTNGALDINAACAKTLSAHYLAAESGEIFNIVEEQFVAYHAGASCWTNIKNINNYSIGIEVVNIARNWLSKFPQERAFSTHGSDITWCTYTEEQILQLIQLCKDIMKRHDIKPYNVVGHSDISCGRKIDPGPMFPWQRLAEAGIGIWHDVKESNIHDYSMPSNPILWAQNKLSEFGYDCQINGVADAQFKNVMQAFQMHFRQANVDGVLDLESLQILDSLCQRKLNYANNLIPVYNV